jgi:hypothetical protein
MKKILFALLIFVTTAAGFIVNAAAENSQLTNSFSQHQYPSTSDGYIAWDAYDGNDYEIYYWDGSDIVQLTNNSVTDKNPSIYVSSGVIQIAWQQWDGASNYEIWYWDGSTTTQVTNYSGNDINPSLYNGQIAWVSWDGSDYEIVFWDGNNVEYVTNNTVEDNYVSNYNGNLAWSQWDDSDYEILYKVGNTITTVTDNNADDIRPSLYDGAIAWYANDGSDNEIYFWNGTATSMVTNNSGDDNMPSLFKNTIAWSGWDGNDYELYYWDGLTTTKVTNNNTSDTNVFFRDDMLVYQGVDAYNNQQIYHTQAPEDPNAVCDIRVQGLSTTYSGKPAAGEKIRYTASVKSGCRGDVYYKFFYRAKYGTSEYETADWIVAKDYSTDNYCDYNFPEAGDYILIVRAVTDPNNEPAALPIFGGIVSVE